MISDCHHSKSRNQSFQDRANGLVKQSKGEIQRNEIEAARKAQRPCQEARRLNGLTNEARKAQRPVKEQGASALSKQQERHNGLVNEARRCNGPVNEQERRNGLAMEPQRLNSPVNGLSPDRHSISPGFEARTSWT